MAETERKEKRKINKTRIPWADYTINPVKGVCPVGCPYCYARRMYKRFKWNPEIRWEPEHLLDLHLMPDGSKVFIGSTMELFGDWITPKWLQDLFYWWIPRYPKLIFIFLTKRPENLIKWSPFPRNCWVGVSVSDDAWLEGIYYLSSWVSASVKFLSIEPFLSEIKASPYDLIGISWLILGSQTQPVVHPRREWVEEIIRVADKVGIPVFVKEPLASHLGIHRQEFPRGAQ